MPKQHMTDDPISRYVADNSLRLNPAQESLIEATKSLGPPSRMLGAADALQLLANMCRLISAKKALDVGTFTGYSAMTVAEVLPADGKVITMDVSNAQEELFRKHWKMAGVEEKIDFRLGPASETLRSLVADRSQLRSFDVAFIDADKTGYDDYYELCLQLIRPGGIIAVDNVLWGGRVADAADNTADTVAIRQLNQKLLADDRVNISMVINGDGLTLAFVK